MSDSGDFDCDVALIGYGPSGVSAANFLGARGVRVIAVERAASIYERARAVTVDDWTMRCYQSVGLDAGLKAVMDETVALRWVTYDGRELRRVELPRRPTENGHAKSYAIYQPTMEQVLRDGAARFDSVAVRFGIEVTGVEQDAGGVTLPLSEGSPIRARYALACDGGASATRERLGIPLLGDTGDTRWVVIDARVKRWWPDRQVLTFWSDRERPVVDIALAKGNHRWELPLRPEESEDDFSTHEQLWTLLATMGVTPDDVEIHQHAFYRHHVRSAKRWREGRVFLVGDAAHLMPPWAGQGMQLGIRDAHNLAWKLDGVLAGWLPETILDTYQPERAPDVARCTMLSLALGAVIKREMPDPPPGAPPPGPPPEATLPALRAGWVTAPGTGPVGRMLPQPRVATPSGRIVVLDALLGDGLVLLGDDIDPRTLLDAGQRTAWEAAGARFLTIRRPDRPSAGADTIVDLMGDLGAWMHATGVRVVAVRPDRFIAASDLGGLDLPGSAPVAAPRRAPAAMA